MLRQLLGDSRYVILPAVAGTFLASLALGAYGILRAVAIVIDTVQHGSLTDAYAKQLIVSSVTLIDIFLLGTVLFIFAAGLFELFIADLPLPGWLRISSLDDLKGRLMAVIIVALLVAFLGYALDWKGGWEILAPGIAIAAVILATAVVFRLVAADSAADGREP